MSECLEENEIVDLVAGNLEADEAASAELHIDGCAACRLVLIELARVFELRASALPAADPSVESATDAPEFSMLIPALARGSTIDRYMVVEVLGTGAMGIVYAAYDPELDRKVALKLLRGKLDPTRGDRLVREARATAKLSHPNVVVVHDVGTHEGAVFMAMEYVRGGTLGEWLGAQKRSHKAIFSAFDAAGQGLAAAHEAGLVHRDFKPANVLMGHDGRVRVTDFGLARIGDADIDDGAVSTTLEASASLVTLTKTGMIIGTPAYMSPEQFSGDVADARSDQFSFCVALYEALCEERPFAGRSFAELASTVSAGRVREGSGFSSLPRNVQAALKRGLSVDPQARFESVNALRSALSPKDTKRSIAVPAVFAGTVALGLGGLGLSLGGQADAGPPEDPCVAARTSWTEGVWTAQRRDALDSKLRSSGHAYANDVATTVQRDLDAFSAAWVDAYDEACAASPTSATTACVLDGRLAAESLLSALEEGDESHVEFAVQAVQRLPDPKTCRGGEQELLLAAPVPPDGLREAVESARETLALSEALYDTHQYVDGAEQAQWVYEEAVRLGYAPLQAEAALWLGLSQAGSGEDKDARASLTEAAQLAWSSGHERVAMRASNELVMIEGVVQHEHAAGQVWAELAQASSKRLAAGPLADAELAYALGALAHERSDFPAAKEQLTQALQLRQANLPQEHHLIGSALRRLVAAELQTGQFGPARELAAQAYASDRASLGEYHPNTLRSRTHEGIALLQLGKLDEAKAVFDPTLANALEALGPTHTVTAELRHALAAIANRQGRYDEAETIYKEVLAVQLETREDQMLIATLYHNLGNAAFRQKHNERARTYLSKALEAFEAELGPDHPRSTSSLGQLVAISVAMEHCDEAVEYGRHALKILEAANDPAWLDRTVYVRGTLSDALRCAGKLDEAANEARIAFDAAFADDNLMKRRAGLADILADIELSRGRLDSAETAARAGLEQAKDDYDRASFTLWIAKATVRRDPQAAVAQVRAAIEMLGESEKGLRTKLQAFVDEHAP